MFFLLLIGVVLLIMPIIYEYFQKDFSWKENSEVSFYSGVIILSCLIIVLPMIYFSSVSTVSWLRAWESRNAETAKTAIIESANKAIVWGHMPQNKQEELLNLALTFGESEIVNLDNLSHSTQIVGMIRDYRDNVLRYNKQLQKYRMLYKHWFLWPFIASVENLEPMGY